MLEKEIKILEVNKEELIKRLEELGAVKTFEDTVCDTYYDYANAKMEDKKRLFRLRTKWDCNLYTIKKKEKGGEIRISQEKECVVTDIEGFKKTLEKYGLVPTREKTKQRLSYKIDHLEFDIDEYEGIPTFLEIEASSDEEINIWIEKLGLQNNVRKTFGSRGLFEYYKMPYTEF